MVASNKNNIPSLKMDGVPEIVFFDIETTVPNRAGPGHERRFWVLEFGAIVVCPQKLVEIDSYCTLIKPGDLSVVALRPTRKDGITRHAVAMAPTFDKVADKIYEVLHGRIWSGHNIQRFDCLRIKEAFAEIGRPAPQPIGIIDSLGVLSDKFGKRAGDMKMATLANYFGLGQQKHRSLDDVRMNLEVLKSCATVLLLESSLPNVLNDNWRNGCSKITTRSRNIVDNGKTSFSYREESSCRKSNVLNDNWRNGCSKITTRSRNIVDNGKTSFSYREESSCRKSPPLSVSHQRSVPYVTRSSLRKMTDTVKSILCRAQTRQSINNLIRHSHYILR